jgi:hypothetical protein
MRNASHIVAALILGSSRSSTEAAPDLGRAAARTLRVPLGVCDVVDEDGVLLRNGEKVRRDYKGLRDKGLITISRDNLP